MSTNVTLANRLVEIRKKRHLTQTQLVKSINDESYNEISRVSLGNYESGKRYPDSNVIKFLCEKLNVSADYLLGLTDTENQAYAKIAETTGLTETSIDYLNRIGNNHRSIINCLFEDEPGLPPDFIDSDPDYEVYLNDPEYVELLYQEYLKQLEWEERMKETSILDHVANEWGYRDFIKDETEEEHAARMEAESKAFEKDMPEILKEMSERYADIDPAVFGPIDYDEIGEQRRIQDEQNFIEKEAKKSNLLTAIVNYVAYTSGCSLETTWWSEELTPLHSINIGTGKGNTITFPSKQGDELLEFMLLQKVIDALKKFKTNCSLKND